MVCQHACAQAILEWRILVEGRPSGGDVNLGDKINAYGISQTKQ